MLLGQFSVTFEYRPGSQCLRPDCPVGPTDMGVVEASSTSELTEQPFAESAMGDSMDSDILPELSGETWVAATHLDETTSDLPTSEAEPDLISSSFTYRTLIIVREWVRAGAPPTWLDCVDYPRSCVRGISNSAICP